MEPNSMNSFVEFIRDVGFPIAAFCAMFYMCNTTIKENTKVISELSHFVRKLGDDDEQ